MVNKKVVVATKARMREKHFKLKGIMVTWFSLILFNLTCIGQDAERILAKYFASVSPDSAINNWPNIKTMSADTRGSFSGVDARIEPSNDLPPYFGKLLRKWPDKQKEILYGDSVQKTPECVFIFNKSRRVVKIGNLPPQESNLDPLLFFDFFPLKIYEMTKKPGSTSYNGVVKLAGVSNLCEEIELKSKRKGDFDKLYFDEKTHLLAAVGFSEENIYWIVSKYKDFGGFQIPTFIAYLKNETVFSWREYLNISLNVDIDPREFQLK